MSNLGKAYPLDQVGQFPTGSQLPVYAAAVLYEGAMVCARTADGYAVRAGTGSTGPVLGIAHATADNSAAGASSGDVSVNLIEGLFWRPNHGTHTVTIADVGKAVYASDDNTISNVATDGPFAGTCYGVDTAMGVLVAISSNVNQAHTPLVSLESRLSVDEASALASAGITSAIASCSTADISVVTRLSTIDSGLLCADASIITRFSTVDSGLLCNVASIVTRFSDAVVSIEARL